MMQKGHLGRIATKIAGSQDRFPLIVLLQLDELVPHAFPTTLNMQTLFVFA